MTVREVCAGGQEAWWCEGRQGIEADHFDEFLVWASDQGASDICLQSGRHALVERDGRLSRAAVGLVDTAELVRICDRIYGATAEGVLRTGRDLDFSYEARAEDLRRLRFRVNVAPVEAWGAYGLNLTFRILLSTSTKIDGNSVAFDRIT